MDGIHTGDQTVPAGSSSVALDRPLIQSLMPSAEQINTRFSNPAVQLAAASSGEAKLAGGQLDIPVLDVGSFQGGIAHPKSPAHAEKTNKEADPFKVGGSDLVQRAQNAKGEDLTVAPAGSHVGKIPKKYGCAASLSNLLIQAHQIGTKDFSPSVDGLEKVLREKGARTVDKNHLAKGDIVIGRDELDGSGGRHIGVVDVNAKGQLVVLNNASGHFKEDSLDERFFKNYGKVYGLRRDQ